MTIIKSAAIGILTALGAFIAYAAIIDQPNLAMRAIAGAMGAGFVLAGIALAFYE